VVGCILNNRLQDTAPAADILVWIATHRGTREMRHTMTTRWTRMCAVERRRPQVRPSPVACTPAPSASLTSEERTPRQAPRRSRTRAMARARHRAPSSLSVPSHGTPPMLSQRCRPQPCAHGFMLHPPHRPTPQAASTSAGPTGQWWQPTVAAYDGGGRVVAGGWCWVVLGGVGLVVVLGACGLRRPRDLLGRASLISHHLPSPPIISHHLPSSPIISRHLRGPR